MIRWHVISGVFWRNVKQYFTSVLGYLFIIVFVALCAILTFQPQFFADNLANLDQLSRYFPFLLLFLAPAIAMAVWADEKKQGTDAILFTLPASDLEILLGKYLAVVAVYSIALLFSITQLFALAWIGMPDWGVTLATYFGYWLAGIAMLAIGLFASSLTSSTTVAFVLGALICSLPVIFFQATPLTEKMSIGWQLRDFSVGQISLPSILYFASVVIFMLYLNLVVITRRHWSRGQQVTLGGHFAVRIIGLAFALVSLNLLAETSSAAFPTRLDLTREGLYTLDQTTRDTIRRARGANRPVTIQAFISSNVPRQYVTTKKHLTGLLHQFDRLGGNMIDVRFVEVTPNSPEGEEARLLGVEPRATRDTVGGRLVEQDVYLGAVVTSSLGEVVLPFIDGETSIEYELTRSIGTTTDRGRRLVLGVLKTDAHFDNLEVDGRSFDWSFSRALEELKTQYSVRSVSATDLAGYLQSPAVEPGPGDEESQPASNAPPDVLLVVDPSSLSMTAMTDLVTYIQRGNPVLVLADPLPFFWYTYRAPVQLGVINAPAQPRISPQAYWSAIASTTEPKPYGGRATLLLDALGVEWPHDQVVWQLFNPHIGFQPAVPDQFGQAWPEYYGPRENLFLFVRDQAAFDPFNRESEISRGLQELVLFYPGSLRPASNPKTNFQPLVRLKPGLAGQLAWNEISEEVMREQQSFNPQTGRPEMRVEPMRNFYTDQPLRLIQPNPRRTRDEWSHILAAHITGKDGDKTNVVFIADADFVSDMFFDQQEAVGQALDNMTLLANAIETLAGDTSYVRLRNRRPHPRTLTSVEATVESYRRERAQKQEEFENRIDEQLAEAQTRLDEATAAIEKDSELNVLQKIQQSAFSMDTEQRRFDLKKEKLDKELQGAIDSFEAEEQQKIAVLESGIRGLSIFLATVPAILLGVIVLVTRITNERKHIQPARRV